MVTSPLSTTDATILDLVTDGVLVIDEQGLVLYANHAAHQLLEREELVGKNCGLPLIDSGISLDAQIVRSSGLLWAQLRATLAQWRGQAAQVLTLTDISERKRGEVRIEYLKNLYAVLSRTNEAIVHIHDEMLLLEEVCRIAIAEGHFELAWIGVADQAGERIVPRVQYGRGVGYLDDIYISTRADLAEGRGPTGVAWREGRPVLNNDSSTNPAMSPWLERAYRFNLHSSASFPVLRGGRPFAVLTVYHRERNVFDEEMADLLGEVCGDVGFALEVMDRETQRKEDERLLRQWADAFNHCAHGIALGNPHTNQILAGNPAFAESLGRTVAELSGMSVPDAYAPSEWERVKQQIKIAERDGQVRFEAWMQRADGSQFPGQMDIVCVKDSDGVPLYRVATLQDITLANQAKRRIALNEQRALAMLELVEHAAELNEAELLQHIVDEAVKLTASQIAYLHFVNEDQETLSLSTWSTETRASYCTAAYDNHYPISKAGIWADCFRQRQAVVHNDYPTQADRHGLPEGHASLLRHASVPVIEGGKVRLIFGIGNKAEPYDEADVRQLQLLANSAWSLLQRKRAEEQMRLSAQVYEVSDEGIVITDHDNKIVAVNRAYSEITGYSLEEVRGKNPRIASSHHQTAEFYQAMWRSIKQTGRWQGEVWNRRKSGEIYPQMLSIATICDGQGEVVNHIGIIADISERKAVQQRIEYLAHFDPLTALPNRTLLNDRIEQLLQTSARNQEKFSVMFLDLDRFKNVNDSLGHEVGDKLLVEIARRMVSALREEDTISRQGGDEFVALLPGASAVAAAHVAAKLLTAIALPCLIDGHNLSVSASIGIASFPENGGDMSSLLRNADVALFRAKREGRNNFQLFTEEMHEKARDALRIENDLRQAVARKELLLHYQPQVDTVSGKIVGAEALLRWAHPEWGMVMPGEFIQTAEDSGLIVEIGAWVLETALQQNRAWQLAGLPIVPVAVNLSLAQFRQRTLLETVTSRLTASGLEARYLELELTESIAMEDRELIIQTVDQFHALGVALSIDDFGTGYSSLSYLKRFRINKLKIDQSFVRDLAHDTDDEAIVIAIINMAKSLGFEVIAEGVETAEQFAFLRARQCDQVQGYYFSRPIPPAAFAELLRRGGKLLPQPH